jgi:hypothetical protein
MCLIVDMNIAHRVLKRRDDPDFGPVSEALFVRRKNKARLVYGGRLTREYRKDLEVSRILLQLDRAGAARTVSDRVVDEEEDRLTKAGVCLSDDPHVVALAQVAGVRLLCSHDMNLHADFTNKELLDKPRGKVYQTRKHAPLIRKYCKCLTR